MTKRSPFRYFEMSPGIIRLAVMMHVRFPLSLRNVEDLVHEWSCHGYVPVSQLIYAAFRSNAKGLFPRSDE
jgi:hypothetical protein